MAQYRSTLLVENPTFAAVGLQLPFWFSSRRSRSWSSFYKLLFIQLIASVRVWWGWGWGYIVKEQHRNQMEKGTAMRKERHEIIATYPKTHWHLGYFLEDVQDPLDTQFKVLKPPFKTMFQSKIEPNAITSTIVHLTSSLQYCKPGRAASAIANTPTRPGNCDRDSRCRSRTSYNDTRKHFHGAQSNTVKGTAKKIFRNVI